MSTTFNNVSIAVAGHFSHRSLNDIRIIVGQHGGIFHEDVVPQTRIVLSTSEMSNVLDNPYKLQFFPQLKDQINISQTYSIPIVDDSYIDDCIAQKKITSY